MANSTDLTKVISESFGLSEVLVGSYYKYLRENDQVSKGGRGRNAAKMNSRDASSLAIAAACGEIGRKNASLLVKEYGELQCWNASFTEFVRAPNTDLDRWLRRDPIPDLEGRWGPAMPQGFPELVRRHSFLDALTMLIEAARRPPIYKRPHRITVSFWGPIASATIEVDFSEIIEDENIPPEEYIFEYTQKERIDFDDGKIQLMKHPEPVSEIGGNLETISRFNHESIYDLAELLGE